MTTGGRVAAFGALLVAIFALAAVAGGAFGPAAADDARLPAHGESGEHAHGATGSAPALRLVAASATTLAPGRRGRLSFRVVAPGATTLRDFDTEQGRRMHLIVVRRDLRHFQHLHPRQAADGAWSTPLTLPAAGVYHAFADFATAGERHTLGSDLFAPGRFDPRALPAPRSTARSDGYSVSLREPRAGELRFAVARGGSAVDDLQPYLGARGHLVMLRAGDLAYEHAHPLTARTLAFQTGAAPPGLYRLFLQFRHGGRVHTVAFTHPVAG